MSLFRVESYCFFMGKPPPAGGFCRWFLGAVWLPWFLSGEVSLIDRLTADRSDNGDRMGVLGATLEEFACLGGVLFGLGLESDDASDRVPARESSIADVLVRGLTGTDLDFIMGTMKVPIVAVVTGSGVIGATSSIEGWTLGCSGVVSTVSVASDGAVLIEGVATMVGSLT